ncbi:MULTISPECIES: hydroxymethylglutaryl-CoA lyase [unclassified Variovorax]|uniref:hydroxymethylglutaryl-CoA lyase n=1 Tax=unclassified Variovorax TaxID=663243 RepID=UPI0008B5431A|nr:MULTISPECIES: hydroxymethylglutaryl-CoA lyase [unclassified Variovorax]SEK15943.1 hydroxymethylglutaryl-CoA lyase [Variovorax sp. OK202]SFE25508.1 hydroxymethylglutaryl-CoA lyase [Variovorax sp. OK212]
MSDLPRRVHLHEEGPREGFQIEAGPIASADKVRLIEALAETGLEEVQCVSFVNPERVPGMADAELVARSIRKREGVRYSGLWLNLRGMQRAMRTQLDIEGTIGTSASEAFSVRNNGKGLAALREAQRETLAFCVDHGIAVTRGIVTTAFGCNLEGAIAPATVVERVAQMLDTMAEFGLRLPILRLADTVGWAQPNAIAAVVGAVRERWPELRLGLHLHDTRGTAMANALMGLQMGIDTFDSACAGLGGCPFAGHTGAAGNICTEDLAFMCEEMGIETGVDLEALIGCAQLAEDIVGHPLPGKLMRAGTLGRFRH